MTPRRSGFTLVEIVVGLTIAASVALMAREIALQVQQASVQLQRAERRVAARANGLMILRRALAAVRTRIDTAAVSGNEHVASVASHCVSTAGWSEPCVVTLVVSQLDSGMVLLGLGNSRDPVVLRAGFQAASLRYLDRADHGGRWLTAWLEPNRYPLAIGLIVDGDTALLPVGAVQ